jgi:peptide-methionine (S)-S-oxide reductase
MRYLPASLLVAVALLGCRSTPPPARDVDVARAAREGGAPRELVSMREAAGTTARVGKVGTDPGHAGDGTALAPRPGDELAAFAAGCFWGVEENFRQVPGVVATAVGYSGGRTEHPTYESVCTHTTGHAETVLVEFDPKVVSYATLVRVFFKNHDPTTLNRQGPDVGDQYRSAVFTFSPAQEAVVAAARDQEAKELGRPVTTIVQPMTKFWKAEEYHQQYDEKTGNRSCPTPRGLTAQGT